MLVSIFKGICGSRKIVKKRRNERMKNIGKINKKKKTFEGGIKRSNLKKAHQNKNSELHRLSK